VNETDVRFHVDQMETEWIDPSFGNTFY